MVVHEDLGALGHGTAQDGGVDEGLAEVGLGGAGQAQPFFDGCVEVGDGGVKEGVGGGEGGAGGEGGEEGGAEGGLGGWVEGEVADEPGEGVGC